MSAAGRDVLPPRSVLVTFDDGYRNNLTRAAPILQELGVPALFHISTGYIGRKRLLWPDEVNERVLHWPRSRLPLPGRQACLDLEACGTSRAIAADVVREACKTVSDDERQQYLEGLREEPLPPLPEHLHELYEFLSWDDVRALDLRGFAIGSHTVEHPILTRLDRGAVTRELVQSKQAIERELGKPCRWFAYPNGGQGDFSAAVSIAAKGAGFDAAFTLLGGSNRLPLVPMRIDRICIVRDLTLDGFHARLSGLTGLYHRARFRRRASRCTPLPRVGGRRSWRGVT
jgi:peptidoglycan/xylan/chitin deacetylase (PgdA/CDA1 family)